jgi:predicted dehydrogenase
MDGVEIPALCDINTQKLARAQEVVTKAGRPKPEAYSRSPDDYKRLLARDDLDAVLIATPWELHTPMAVDAMKAGKYAGSEVPAAITTDQCWDLVNTHEKTGVPCMMLENWAFRRDNLAVLNMIRKGLLGEILHCHCSYSHNCLHWFFDAKGNPRWNGQHLLKRNASQYSTHGLGPVISWMDINCGDNYDYLTSTATRSIGINDHFARKFGPDHPAAKRNYAQGDIVTTVIRTHKGNTIVVNYDVQLPRPYDNRWAIQGTRGIYNEQRNAVYLEGISPKHGQWEPFPPYQEKHDHAWWKAFKDKAHKFGHGGTDYMELSKFLDAVRNKTQTPLDVYDSVAICAIIPLSEQSIANGSAPVKCPDFTRGKWKTKKPTFALETA